MKRYVKVMSRHKFAERGGDVLQIYVFMTDIHIIGLKIGLKRHEFVSNRRIISCLSVFRNALLINRVLLQNTMVFCCRLTR